MLNNKIDNDDRTKKNNLKGKLIITGTIEVKTGLSIGGNKSGIEIGQLDNPVIKTHDNAPYIPGSSLKGKLRALLAKAAGSEKVEKDVELLDDENNKFRYLAKVFGFSPDDSQKLKVSGEALLKVRDAFLKENEKGSKKNKRTEEKIENTIDRVTGVANPRPVERVVEGTEFKINLCLDVYDLDELKEHVKLLLLGFDLLEKDYLGGNGTRGYGQVSITQLKPEYYKIDLEEMSLKKDNKDLPEVISEIEQFKTI